MRITMIVEIHDGVMMLTERPMDPTLLEIKRFLAGHGLFGGEEGAHHDMARIATIRLPQPSRETPGPVVAYVNDSAFMLGMKPNCYINGQLIYGPILMVGHGPAGEDRVLEEWEASAYHVDRQSGEAYPTLMLRG